MYENDFDLRIVRRARRIRGSFFMCIVTARLERREPHPERLAAFGRRRHASGNRIEPADELRR